MSTTTTIEVSELFMSLEGEGPYSNRPTTYARLTKCNFQCGRFNNADGALDSKGYAVLGFDPIAFTTLKSLPLITRGCDSQYAVNPAFKHMWESMTVDQMVAGVRDNIPGKKWVHAVTGLPYIFSLTGGEPTMHQKWLPEVFTNEQLEGCQHILIETNCAVPLKAEFLDAIATWLSGDSCRKFTWSNSPKLSVSGETWAKSIRPSIAVAQYDLVKRFPLQCDQYFKFVVDPSDVSFDEVIIAMNEYWAGGIPRGTDVWVMPMACTEEQQVLIAPVIAQRSIEHGFCYSHRIQNTIWGNGVGC